MATDYRKTTKCNPSLPGNTRVERYRHTCGKISVWLLDELFDVVIYLDADGLILRNPDFLFERMIDGLDFIPVQSPYNYTDNIGAHATSSTTFSSALMILRPNRAVYAELLSFFTSSIGQSIDFGDIFNFNIFFKSQMLCQYPLLRHSENILGSQTWPGLDTKPRPNYVVFDFSGPPPTKPWRYLDHEGEAEEKEKGEEGESRKEKDRRSLSHLPHEVHYYHKAWRSVWRRIGQK
jgi:alpha-N-acetylglucosamine transferase